MGDSVMKCHYLITRVVSTSEHSVSTGWEYSRIWLSLEMRIISLPTIQAMADRFRYFTHLPVSTSLATPL